MASCCRVAVSAGPVAGPAASQRRRVAVSASSSLSGVSLPARRVAAAAPAPLGRSGRFLRVFAGGDAALAPTARRPRPEYIPNKISDPKYVRVFDTTLRDGEQSPGATMTSAEKLDIARELHKLGVVRAGGGRGVPALGTLRFGD